jgi:FxsC-like protein
VRLRSERAKYEAYLDALARRIADLLRTAALPEADADLDPETASNAFDHPDQVRLTVPPATETRRVHIVVAAGSRTEMSTVRDDVTFYGDRSGDWSPYRPADREPLAAQARAVAAEQLLGSEVTDLDQLPQRADLARENNDIVVLLVDSWTTKLAAYRGKLMAFDERDDATVAILAPANTADPETVRHRGELRSELSTALPHSLHHHDALVRIEIGDQESFQKDLATALQEAQNRIFSRGRVFRRPTDDPPTGRPILQGP